MNAPMATIHVETTDRKLAAMSKGIELAKVQASIGHLESLCRAKNDATTDFSEAVKAVAEAAHINPGVLSAYVNAVVRDKLKENQAKAEQLALLFDEISA